MIEKSDQSDIDTVKREACSLGLHDWPEWREESHAETRRCRVTGCGAYEERAKGSGPRPHRPPYNPYAEL